MNGPAPRAMIRNLLAALWAIIAFSLAYYDVPAELIALLSGAWISLWGTAEAVFDWWRAQPPKA